MDYLNPLELGEEESFAAALRRRGFDVYVVPVKRTDWLKFASGVVTRDFWSQTMTPGSPSFRWYLDKTVQTVEQAVEGSGGERALIVGHSAGRCMCARVIPVLPAPLAFARWRLAVGRECASRGRGACPAVAETRARPTSSQNETTTNQPRNRRVARPRGAGGRGVGGVGSDRGHGAGAGMCHAGHTTSAARPPGRGHDAGGAHACP